MLAQVQPFSPAICVCIFERFRDFVFVYLCVCTFSRFCICVFIRSYVLCLCVYKIVCLTVCMFVRLHVFVFVSMYVWAVHGGLKEHFKEPSDGCLDLSMCFWGWTHMYEMNLAFKHYSSCVVYNSGAGGLVLV